MPAPLVGQIARVRDRHWAVSDVQHTTQRLDPHSASDVAPQTLVELSSVEDDGFGETLRVIWELEPGATALATATLPRPAPGSFDEPERLDAFLDAVRWGAIASADARALQAPFRSGITIEDYQLAPVVRALQVPRVNLLIADDVGLGKTIEAGLVIQELLLRHRARTVMVVCPASLCLKWQAEMLEKFGLEFKVVDSDSVRELRRDRGVGANIFGSFPRLIVSIDCRVARKAETIRDDLGSAGPVLAEQVELGERAATDDDAFETFPQPPYSAAVEAAGKALDDHRRPLMIANNEGLTKTYNRVHNPAGATPGIVRLRELHRALDLAVRDAYGWNDLELDHGFHETSQGVRYTIGPAARTEVLDRLLELNHERYAEEVAAGLHDKRKGAKAPKRAKPAPAAARRLFDDDTDQPEGDRQ